MNIKEKIKKIMLEWQGQVVPAAVSSLANLFDSATTVLSDELEEIVEFDLGMDIVPTLGLHRLLELPYQCPQGHWTAPSPLLRGLYHLFRTVCERTEPAGLG